MTAALTQERRDTHNEATSHDIDIDIDIYIYKEERMAKVRDYKAWAHDDEIFMRPGEVHEEYPELPPEYPAELESALSRIAPQDVSLTGGPRGKLNERGQLNER